LQIFEVLRVAPTVLGARFTVKFRSLALWALPCALLFLSTASIAFPPAPVGDYLAIDWVGSQDRPVATLWISVKEPKPANVSEFLYFIGLTFVPVSESQLGAVRKHVKSISCAGRAKPSGSEWDVYVVKERISGVATDVCALAQRDACRVASDISAVVLKDSSLEVRRMLAEYRQNIGCPAP
jgi:hypothetical protein